MGQGCSCCNFQDEECYLIETKTGDIKGMGCMSTIFITLVNSINESSECIALNGFFLTAFRKGNWDRFKLKPKFSFVPIKKIIVGRHDDDVSEAWYLDMIRICRHPNDTISEGGSEVYKRNWQYFPVHRWVKCNQFISVMEYDCLLPQFDENRDQRICELAYNQTCYRFNHVPNLPPQCLEIPLDEIFSNYYKWDIVQRKIKIYNEYDLHEIAVHENWKFEMERLSIYQPEGPMKRPNFLYHELDDSLFVFQRLGGCFPNAIKLCTQLPSNVRIDPNLIEPFLEGYTFEEALQGHHLYCVDLGIMAGIHNICSRKEMPSAFALFYLTKGIRKLKVVAIQLFRDDQHNETFLPSDPHPLWLSAKMWFNNAEAIIQLASVLIAKTHMILESIAVAVHRQLSPSHPVYKLIIFAIVNVIPINDFEIIPLTKDNGYLHRATNVGAEGCMKLVKKGWEEWRMDVDGWLPSDLQNRGVYDANTFPDYPFRDDALILFETFKKYVKKILPLYYDTRESLLEDYEVQNWAKELVSPNGADLKGVFGGGSFHNLEDLEKTVISILYISFIYHPAINLPLYDHCASFGVYSTLLLGDPPSHSNPPQTYSNQLSYLPSKSRCIEMLVINLAFAERKSNGLGEFGRTYFYEKQMMAAKSQLVTDLRKISEIINERNEYRTIRYDYLNPVKHK